MLQHDHGVYDGDPIEAAIQIPEDLLQQARMARR